MSAYELLDHLRPTGVAAPPTVYRALDKLIAAGKVHRVASLNAFVACRSGEHQHGEADHDHRESACQLVGFTICDTCGAVDEFDGDDLAGPIRQLLASKGFQPRAGALEIRGICEACAPASP